MSSDSFNRSRGRKAGLGSLAQSARGKQLRSARNILFFVGGWLLVSLVFEWLMFQNELDKARGAPKAIIDQAYTIMYVASAGYVILSITYIIFGFVVQKYPVPITITGLVLFIGLLVIFAAIAPETIAKGIIIKVIVIVGLAKAIQAAIAYQREVDADKSFDERDDYQPRRKREPDERDDLEDEEARPRRRRADEDDDDEDDELRRRARKDW